MNRTMNASLLAAVFAVASLGTVACAAPTEGAASSDAPAAGDAVPAEALAGSAGASQGNRATGLEGAGEIMAAPAQEKGVAQLIVTEGTTKTTYELLSYRFGVTSTSTLSSATGGALAAKPTLSDLVVKVRPSPSAKVLRANAFGGKPLSMQIVRPGVKGATVEVASFGTARVNAVETSATSGAEETYSIAMGKMSLSHGGAKVTVDLVGGTTACEGALGGACPCDGGTAAKMGTFVQAPHSSWAIEKDATRIDHVDVELHNASTIGSATGGATAGKPVLDGITFGRSLETRGLCAVYHTARGNHSPDLKIGVASSTSTPSAPHESITWNACGAMFTGVELESTDTDTYASFSMMAGGLVRTDRSFDDVTFKLITTSTAGWSFTANRPIASCQDWPAPTSL